MIFAKKEMNVTINDIKALEKGYHVLCEKPPCFTPEQAQECADAAEKAGKVLMYAFVCRFTNEMKYLKEYIDSGRMGEIYQAEAVSVGRCSMLRGWFVDKELAGGGVLLDAAIHRIDEAMYLMGYPKVKMVVGYSNNVNSDLPTKVKGIGEGWASCDVNDYKRTVESAAGGYVALENGACLFVKSGGVMYTVEQAGYIDLVGDKGGTRYTYGKAPKLVTNIDDYIYDMQPEISGNINPYNREVDHFIDCCINGTECIAPGWQAVEVMKIIDGIYKSAETGKPVIY